MSLDLDRARAIADAVMMEGYALYPYRASAPKNRYRWTFGVLAPRAWSESGGCEPWWLEAQLLVAGTAQRIEGQLRFFQIERRHDATGHWDEGIVRSINFDASTHSETAFFFESSTARTETTTHERARLEGWIVTASEPVAADRPLRRVTVRVENRTPWSHLTAPRELAIASSFAATHLLVGVDSGELLSVIDPPSWAAHAAPACRNTRTHPVLVGEDIALCAPFIMCDQPQIAPESTGDLCDATEIDELLLLRTRTLTDAEKREARATGPRTAAIVDRAEALPNEALARLHGATRDLRDGEMIPRALDIGSKVRLRAPTRNTDAQDLLYVGHVATVAKIEHDVDGTWFYGVTIDGDPAAAMHEAYARYRYYRAEELEPL